jgi:hypothetical protein
MGTATADCEHIDEPLVPCGAYRRAVKRELSIVGLHVVGLHELSISVRRHVGSTNMVG